MSADPVDLNVVLIHQEKNLFKLDMQLRRPGASTPSDPLSGVRPLVTIDEVEALSLTGDSAALGAYLGNALLQEDAVRAAWEWCRGVAMGVERPLRLRLELDDALQYLPWETLDLPGVGQVALSERILFSRFLPARQLGAALPRRGALRAAVAVAAPKGLDRYKLEPPDADSLLAPVKEALGGVRVSTVKATEAVLLRRLRSGCDILYLACHGRFSSKGPVLLLEDNEGQTDPVNGAELAAAIGRLPTLPQLVVLVSCQSAGDGARKDVARALGPLLVLEGVPAVVAMQGDLSEKTAALFFPPFFESLLRDGFVDQAMAVGRQAAHSEERPDATVPLLFMRLDTGRLFEEDPVLQTQQAMAKADDLALFAEQRYIPLPIDVIVVGEQQSIASLEETGGLQTSARDLGQVVDEYLNRRARARPQLLFLVGSYGTNRTTQMERIVWEALQREDARRLPVYIDLRDYPRARRGERDPIIHLIFRALRDYWPDLTKSEVSALLKEGPRLHLLFDRGENLPEGERRRAWDSIALFSANSKNKHGRHDYIITAVPPSEMQLSRAFAGVQVTRLYVQPLSLRKVRRFLYHWTQERSMPALYEYLVRARLTDLVRLPFLMVRFLLRGMIGELAATRSAFIQELLDDAIIKLADRPDMASHAMPFLTTLAWEMRLVGAEAWSLDKVYGLLQRIRGQREYSLTHFLEVLIDKEILTRVGADEVGFSYTAIHAYCCALAISGQETWEQIVDDIVITLGNEERRRRWSDTLIFLASIFSHSLPDFKRLLYKIVYGADLFQSDLVFLTANCLMQGRQLLGQSDEEAPDGAFVSDLERQVIDALAWRLDPQNEARPTWQEQAVELLGQLAYVSPRLAVPLLVQTANRRVRLSVSGASDFHFSNVRFTALMALGQLWQSVHIKAGKTAAHESLAVALGALEQAMLTHLAVGDADLQEVLEAWIEPADTEALRAQFLENVRAVTPAKKMEADVAGLAAMALGDLTNRQSARAPRVSQEAGTIVKFLGEQLLQLSPAEHDATLWAVTHALAMGPVEVVHRHVIKPFVQQDLKQDDSDDPQTLQRHKYMAYLVGRLRLRNEEVYDFLRVKCLGRFSDMRLWVSVIDALGWIADRNREQHLRLVENLALGRFDTYFPNTRFNQRETFYVRRRALGVLGDIGGREALDKLRETEGTPASLLPTLQRTRQQIILRLEEERRDGGDAAADSVAAYFRSPKSPKRK